MWGMSSSWFVCGMHLLHAFLPFSSWIIFYCVGRPHFFLYPFICWCALGSFPPAGYYPESCCYGCLCPRFYLNICFQWFLVWLGVELEGHMVREKKKDPCLTLVREPWNFVFSLVVQQFYILTSYEEGWVWANPKNTIQSVYINKWLIKDIYMIRKNINSDS